MFWSLGIFYVAHYTDITFSYENIYKKVSIRKISRECSKSNRVKNYPDVFLSVASDGFSDDYSGSTHYWIRHRCVYLSELRRCA